MRASRPSHACTISRLRRKTPIRERRRRVLCSLRTVHLSAMNYLASFYDSWPTTVSSVEVALLDRQRLRRGQTQAVGLRIADRDGIFYRCVRETWTATAIGIEAALTAAGPSASSHSGQVYEPGFTVGCRGSTRRPRRGWCR